MESPVIARWTTDEVSPIQRFDYYADALGSAMVPMQVSSHAPATFRSEMEVADLGAMSVIGQRGSAHRCYTEPSDLDRKSERTFHIVTNLISPWGLTHRGRIRLNAGDAVLVDTEFTHSIEMESDYQVVNVKFSESWLRQWVPVPGALVARRIPADSGWGRALTSFAAQLSPTFVVHSPLPRSVIVDHVGALLALIASEVARSPDSRPVRGYAAMHERIKDLMIQRCAEPSLAAEDVATSLSVSTRTVHRCLAAFGGTFGASLISARVDLATRMLESPLFRRLTIAEVGRRAGFVDPSHFSRVVRARSGALPSEIRAGCLSASADRNDEATL